MKFPPGYVHAGEYSKKISCSAKRLVYEVTWVKKDERKCYNIRKNGRRKRKDKINHTMSDHESLHDSHTSSRSDALRRMEAELEERTEEEQVRLDGLQWRAGQILGHIHFLSTDTTDQSTTVKINQITEDCLCLGFTLPEILSCIDACVMDGILTINQEETEVTLTSGEILSLIHI